MPYRITSETEAGREVVHLAGHLDANAARDLRALLEASDRSTALDLADTRYADREAVAVLVEARRCGIEILGPSQFIATLLATGSRSVSDGNSTTTT